MKAMFLVLAILFIAAGDLVAQQEIYDEIYVKSFKSVSIVDTTQSLIRIEGKAGGFITLEYKTLSEIDSLWLSFEGDALTIESYGDGFWSKLTIGHGEYSMGLEKARHLQFTIFFENAGVATFGKIKIGYILKNLNPPEWFVQPVWFERGAYLATPFRIDATDGNLFQLPVTLYLKRWDSPRTFENLRLEFICFAPLIKFESHMESEVGENEVFLNSFRVTYEQPVLLGYAVFRASRSWNQIITNGWVDGEEVWSAISFVRFEDPTGVNDYEATPNEFALNQNYPNPFNPTTTIRYSLGEMQHVRLAIYDTNGQLVRNLVSGTQDAGQYQVQWNATDDNGATVTSGIYFCRLSAGDRTDVRRMVLLK